MPLFHFDRGLFLTTAGLAVDVPRRQAVGFISHAHTDHVARHELALCTPETGKLYVHRFGRRDVRPLPFRETTEWNDVKLTTFPAGHCLGSAMLLAEERGTKLLYTGDFKLSPSRTAGSAEFPRADILVMETTFGDPQYRFPPRAEIESRLLEIVQNALHDGAIPVIHAYSLGKSQEVTRLLSDAGFGVLQHKLTYEISQVYTACGAELGKYALYRGLVPENHCLLVPPHKHRGVTLPSRRKTVRIAVTGWATNDRAIFRWGVDHAVPLSDHADFEELFQAIELSGASEIYCTHGPESFAGILQDRGINAHVLGKRSQKRLFL